eukprot:365276-Chlamydomonas_euryale.AAC.10
MGGENRVGEGTLGTHRHASGACLWSGNGVELCTFSGRHDQRLQRLAPLVKHDVGASDSSDMHIAYKQKPAGPGTAWHMCSQSSEASEHACG